jgi:hypothetical protein
MSTKMTLDEKRWRAESDAETMARYQEIMSDSSRKAAAIKAAKAKANDLTKRAQAMQFAAGGKINRKK